MSTLKEIAETLGVSESTISRGLSDNPRISKELRERIKKTALEMDFEYNSNARSLSTSRCKTIGVIYPDYENEYHNSQYLDLLVNDVRHNLEKLGYDCLIFQATRPTDGASNMRRLILQKKVDGFVVVVSNMQASDWDIVAKYQVPMVQIHSKPLYAPAALKTSDYDYFFTDNRCGGHLATEHLLARGCTSILCLADRHAGPEMIERTQGYLDAIEGKQRPFVLDSVSDFDSVLEFLRGHWVDIDRVDGIFAHTDIMAIAAIQACREKGIDVPTKLRIVGFDDIPMGKIMSPKLTTVHQPREAEAELACRQLARLIEDTALSTPREQRFIKPTLIVRESA